MEVSLSLLLVINLHVLFEMSKCLCCPDVNLHACEVNLAWFKSSVCLFSYPPSCSAVYELLTSQKRYQSSYVGNLARRVRDADEASEVAHLKELFRRNDPEAVIRLFETQPSLHHNATALSEYVKALVKVDRLDESELLKTLQRGGFNTFVLF